MFDLITTVSRKEHHNDAPPRAGIHAEPATQALARTNPGPVGQPVDLLAPAFGLITIVS
ncbi:hypothetical protein AB0878_10365 [Amycolatopsis sp. NPDC047767]|uniref:hypothetical protein n=1 Tax=Amycolatopsis sp. NPDC047767 TaxID=3156765 RepID=UPI0034539B7F